MLTTTNSKEITLPSDGGISEAELAAEELYARYAPVLRRIALTRYRIPREDVEALVNDVFATYIGHAPHVRVVRAYLIGAIQNAAMQYNRTRIREANMLAADSHSLPSREEGIADVVGRKLLLATVLSRVSGRCRDLLRRYYLEEESTASIAADRGTTSDYVLILLHNCRKRARSICHRLVESKS